eukprot:TRINITY_DN48110_c1_g1_i1.p1 TRINITY_DN48110_c1_g1~~TRINITY_DN48110_c1_g1_i1.p1  ORF type:complete len:324 (+),score=108.61 TRINITY_DN48110_c1_g1_i1:62-1033(+)
MTLGVVHPKDSFSRDVPDHGERRRVQDGHLALLYLLVLCAVCFVVVCALAWLPGIGLSLGMCQALDTMNVLFYWTQLSVLIVRCRQVVVISKLQLRVALGLNAAMLPLSFAMLPATVQFDAQEVACTYDHSDFAEITQLVVVFIYVVLCVLLTWRLVQVRHLLQEDGGTGTLDLILLCLAVTLVATVLGYVFFAFVPGFEYRQLTCLWIVDCTITAYLSLKIARRLRRRRNIVEANRRLRMLGLPRRRIDSMGRISSLQSSSQRPLVSVLRESGLILDIDDARLIGAHQNANTIFPAQAQAQAQARQQQQQEQPRTTANAFEQ